VTPASPLPASMSARDVARWLDGYFPVDISIATMESIARAVLALVEAKVREALRRQERAFITALPPCPDSDFDAILSHVMGRAT